MIVEIFTIMAKINSFWEVPRLDGTCHPAMPFFLATIICC